MAKFQKHEVVAKILELGLVPVFYNGDFDIAKNIVKACWEGGGKVVEFTNRGDRAYKVFTELANWVDVTFSDLILGVGSVVDPHTAAIYINSGANFVVGPVLNAEIAKVCNRRKIPYSPGCGSASEISKAEEEGSDIVKVFLGHQVGGPKFIKSVLGPCPWMKLMPTGGVNSTRENIHEWIKAGASALGIGSKLISKEKVAARDFEGITELTEKCLWWIKEARGTPLFLGVDHIGLYPESKGTGKQIADWYEKNFGFTIDEGGLAFHVPKRGIGELEIFKEQPFTKCHIAIKVSNFEKACEYIKSKGIELEEPVIKKGFSKVVYLKENDPVGNKIHLIFRY